MTFASSGIDRVVSVSAEPHARGVEVSWIASSGPDGLGFHVLRSEAGAEYEEVAAWVFEEAKARGATRFHWVDEEARPGVRYDYRIQSVPSEGPPVEWPATAAAAPPPALAAR